MTALTNVDIRESLVKFNLEDSYPQIYQMTSLHRPHWQMPRSGRNGQRDRWMDKQMDATKKSIISLLC